MVRAKLGFHNMKNYVFPITPPAAFHLASFCSSLADTLVNFQMYWGLSFLGRFIYLNAQHSLNNANNIFITSKHPSLYSVNPVIMTYFATNLYYCLPRSNCYGNLGKSEYAYVRFVFILLVLGKLTVILYVFS